MFHSLKYAEHQINFNFHKTFSKNQNFDYHTLTKSTRMKWLVGRENDIVSHSEMIYSIWEDVRGLYANSTPFYI